MKRPIRLCILLLALTTLFIPFGVGASPDITCDDFANPDAAQVLLDADPRAYEDALDPDGDGTACNDDRDDDTHRDRGDEDTGLTAEEYIDAIWDEVDLIGQSIDDLVATVNSLSSDMTSDEQAEAISTINRVYLLWRDYPGDAPVFDTPAGYAEIEAVYTDFVTSVGDCATTWDAFWSMPEGADEDEVEDALDAFNEAIGVTQAYEEELLGLLADAEANLDA